MHTYLARAFVEHGAAGIPRVSLCALPAVVYLPPPACGDATNKVEAGKSWKIQVKGVRLKVPENAKCSIEHERCVRPCRFRRHAQRNSL